jgi:hypothetical protein
MKFNFMRFLVLSFSTDDLQPIKERVAAGDDSVNRVLSSLFYFDALFRGA